MDEGCEGLGTNVFPCSDSYIQGLEGTMKVSEDQITFLDNNL